MAKTILVTGASSGIGNATARLFQEKGWNVVATMRNPEAGASLASLDRVRVTRLDVTDSASIQSSVAEAIEQFGSIDVLVNNAGYGAYGPLEAFDMEGIRRQFDTNVLGLLEVTKAVLPGMRTSGSGTIVNVSSMGGQIAFPLGTLYHGTKFAVEGLSEALHYELSPIGIRLKIVQPGMVATDFGGRSFDFRDGDIPEYASIVPSMGKGFGTIVNEFGVSKPLDVAQVIFRAATDDAATLRYRAGDDAEALITKRNTTADDVHISGMRERFGL